jgi:hypothetical protein
LNALCRKVGRPLTKKELNDAIDILDKDRNGASQDRSNTLNLTFIFDLPGFHISKAVSYLGKIHLSFMAIGLLLQSQGSRKLITLGVESGIRCFCFGSPY